MHWLFDLIIDLLLWLLPGNPHREDRSIVGESRKDRETRWIAWAVIALIAVAAVAYTLWKK